MGTYIEQYVYDAVGNFLSMQHRGSDPAQPGWNRSYAYNEASLIEPAKKSNRLSSTTIGAATATYGYDGSAGLHGNITAMPHLPLMQWDYQDQLQATSKQVLNNGGTPETTSRVYDAAGQRVRKVTERQAAAGQTPTRRKERIYLGGFEIYREYENDGLMVTLERETLHIMDDQQRIALVETRTQGSDPAPEQLIRYQFGNHLGSASLEIDDQAQIISYEEYYPYGSPSYQAVRRQTETPKRYCYTGMERDEENGLNYHGARYYAPWLGRWLNCDPIGIKDGLNTFRSFHDNPVLFRDPNGLQNTPSNFVEYATSIEGGLNRIAELGLQEGIEYGLAQDPKTQNLMVLRGSTKEISFGRLTPLGHTHTGRDTTVNPSTADLNEFARKNVKEHWIFSQDEGWARIRHDAKTKSFDVLRNRGGKAVRFAIFENPDFNPRDTTPIGEYSRWRFSVEDVKGEGTVEPLRSRGSGLPVQPRGFPWSRWGLRAMVGSVAAAGVFVMWNRYKNAIQSDVAAGTGGTNTLKQMQTDIQIGAFAHGIASLGSGPRRAVGAAGTFFLASDVSSMIFGGPSIGERWENWENEQARRPTIHEVIVHQVNLLQKEAERLAKEVDPWR